MKEATDQKNEIIATRKGGLGSSDAKLVASVGRNGKLSDAQRNRLAVMLGLAEQKQFSTKATDYGNYIEECVFEKLKSDFPNAVSNPFTKHESLSEQYGFDIFNHVDFEVDQPNTLVWFECKAVNDDIDETIQKYKDQLAWHIMIGQSKAEKMGKKFVLMLAHYHTTDKESEFSVKKLTLMPVISISVDFVSGFKIIAKEIENFEYKPSEELSSYNLPEPIQNRLEEIYLNLRELEEINRKVDDFKAKILDLMIENNVKSIDNELFKITTVAGGESIGFDAKKFESENPEIHSKYLTKKTVRKSYLKLTLKN